MSHPLPGEIVFQPYDGPCPSCGGHVRVVKTTLFDMLENAPTIGPCVYAKWLRDGVQEDGGICRGKR